MVRETRYLWVGNLPHTIREERILEHFKRYGKVQSVKILPKTKEEDICAATVAFIDIKSAAKAHNADNKIEERTLKTDYYEPSSTAGSTSIYIHERDDAPYPRANSRYGLSEDRNYDRPGHYYADREPYLRRPHVMAYHDEDNFQGRAKSRDRYNRTAQQNNYTEGTDRNQNHFRPHNNRQHFEQQRYPVNDQYSDEREPPTPNTQRLNNSNSRRSNNNSTSPLSVTSITSPTPIRAEKRPHRTKHRNRSPPSRSPSESRSNSRSRSRSSSNSPSSSSSSKQRSSSSGSSGRSPSPSKSRSPGSAYSSQTSKSSRLDRPSSTVGNPSNAICHPTVNSSTVNCSSTPCNSTVTLENHCDVNDKRPLGICVRNLPVRSTDTSLKDGLFHEYKKHGKVTMVKVIGQGTDRYALVCFKKPEDVEKALEVSKGKQFFGCKIEVTAHEGLDAEDNDFRPLEADLDEFHTKATRTLFIGNLEKDITANDLKDNFDQFGEILEIDIKKQASPTSYAFIQYNDITSVVKAMRKLDGENIGANRIKLGFGKSMPTPCVWVDGIAESVSEQFLVRHFSRFGLVSMACIDKDRGHGLVLFESMEFAQVAVGEMRGRILQGKKLQVDFASREAQIQFLDRVKASGKVHLWERRRGPEFDAMRMDERYERGAFENRNYPRYDGQQRQPRGNFRGNQRSGFASRGRGQNFSPRYEGYHEDFVDRRHRYNSREDLVSDVTPFDNKVDRAKYVAKRTTNKLRNSIGEPDGVHHSQSPTSRSHRQLSDEPEFLDGVSDLEQEGSEHSFQLDADSGDESIKLNDSIKLKGKLVNSHLKRMNCVSDSEELILSDGGKCDSWDRRRLSIQMADFPESAHSSDNELLDDEQSHRRHRSPSVCSDTNDSVKSLTKDDCPTKPNKNKDSSLSKQKSKSDSLEGSVSIDLPCQGVDPRRQPKSRRRSRRIRADNDACLPNTQEDSFLCDSPSMSGDTSRNHPSDSYSDIDEDDEIDDYYVDENRYAYVNEEEVEDDFDAFAAYDSLNMQDELSDEESSNKRSLVRQNSSPLPFVYPPFHFQGRTSLDSHGVRRKIIPVCVLEPVDFAFDCSDDEGLSPTASPSVVSSPKTATAHSPRAGLSPSYVAAKPVNRLTDHHEKKYRSVLKTEDTSNGPVEIEILDISQEDDLPIYDSIASPVRPKEKDLHSSPDFSPSASPNCASIEERIKALDAKFNQWSGATRGAASSTSDVTSTPDSVRPLNKKPRYSKFLPVDKKNEPSNIVAMLTQSTIFDQDSERLQNIDSKYQPKDIAESIKATESSSPPKSKLTFRTKAAAKEFSSPIQSYSAPPFQKPLANVIGAHSIISPPATPQSASAVSSPITPLHIFNQQLPPNVITPCSPCTPSSPFVPPTPIKSEFHPPTENCVTDLKSASLIHSAKNKSNPEFQSNTTVLATSLKSPLHCPVESVGHTLSLNSPPGSRKEPATPVDSATEAVCKVDAAVKPPPRRDAPVAGVTNIPPRKDSFSHSTPKDHSHFVAFDHDRRDSVESKDPRLQFHGSYKENLSAKEEIREPSAKSFVTNPSLDINSNTVCSPAVKRRVSSIDSTESDSCKSIKSVESNRDNHEKISEPEPKKIKLTRKISEPSLSSSSSSQHSHKKIEVKEKKLEKSKSTDSNKSTSSEKLKHDVKVNNKYEHKDKVKSEHKNREEKHSKPHEAKQASSLASSKSDSKSSSKSKERQNSDKDLKAGLLNHQLSKSRKEKDQSVNKSDKAHEKSEKSHEKFDKLHEKSEKSHDKSDKFHEKSEKSHDKSERSHEKISKSHDKIEKSHMRIEKTEKQSEKNDKLIEKSEKSSEKSDKTSEKKQSEKKSKINKNSLPFDLQAILDEEPVYFSMYDKVKARSSKQQTLKSQTNDLESVRQKFSKLKQKRAKRDEKSKSIDHDSDRETDSEVHHSSESDSQTKSNRQTKHPKKRKLLINSSSDDDLEHHDMSSKDRRAEKEFTDSGTDSEFEFNVSRRQLSTNKIRRKKSEIFVSDNSDSDSSPLALKTQKKKSSQSRTKSLDKQRKSFRSEDDSEVDVHTKTKDKDMKNRKPKKERTIEHKHENKSIDVTKKVNDDHQKDRKKLIKEHKMPEIEMLSHNQKKAKSELSLKEKILGLKERKPEVVLEKIDLEDLQRHKTFKKRKKSKKISKNKEKRNSSDKTSQDSIRKYNDIDSKSSPLPILSPKPPNLRAEKPSSPPCLHIGGSSDKSDLSDFEFEIQRCEEVTSNWKGVNAKTSAEKSSKKKGHSLDNDFNLPFYDKLSDVTDSEMGKDNTDFGVEEHRYLHKKEGSHKSKHDKHDAKHSDPPLKEDKHRRKSKKQSREHKKKPFSDHSTRTDSPIKLVPSPKALFDSLMSTDSIHSNISLHDEDDDEEEDIEHIANHLGVFTAADESSLFGDENMIKREEKAPERRFEEEAAKETERLEAELQSTVRVPWHMQENDFVPANSVETCEEKDAGEVKEDSFNGLDTHSSLNEHSQGESELFLSGAGSSYKMDEKEVNEMEDQRKIEDDLAVSALLQEMNCNEIPAPELTKETDYMESIIETHPEDTMNYLLPADDSENSLQIADSSPEPTAESPGEKLGSSAMSPTSNSEPPALEISNLEEMKKHQTVNLSSVLTDSKGDSGHIKLSSAQDKKLSNYDCRRESNPPVINIPTAPRAPEVAKESVSPKSDLSKLHKSKDKHSLFAKSESNDDIDNDSELHKNQLSHFEDITMDTADNKDDDNPPVLVPVDAPRNLLPPIEVKTNSAFRAEPEMSFEAQKTPVIMENVSQKKYDVDKQIGDMLNRITSEPLKTSDILMPPSEPLTSFSISDPHLRKPMSGFRDHLNKHLPVMNMNTSVIFGCSKPEQFDPNSKFDSLLSKPFEKPREIVLKTPSFIKEADDDIFPRSTNASASIPVINYSENLRPPSDRNIIQSPQKIGFNAALDSRFRGIKMDSPFDNHNIMRPQSSSEYLFDQLTAKSSDTNKSEGLTAFDKLKTSYNAHLKPETRTDIMTPPSFMHKPPNAVTPSFNIPFVSDLNKSIEFSKEAYERPLNSNKDQALPRLLNFSSGQLFSDLSNKPTIANAKISADVASTFAPKQTLSSSSEKQDSTVSPEKTNVIVKTEAIPKSEIESMSNSDFDKKPDVPITDIKPLDLVEVDQLSIDESLDRKSRPTDSESVCSDTTDITIPDTKTDTESGLASIGDEQRLDEPIVADPTIVNAETEVVKPRRGRKPKNRKTVEVQKPDIVTRSRRARNVSTDQPRRSLRSDALEESRRGKKRVSIDETTHSESEELKKDDESSRSKEGEEVELEKKPASKVGNKKRGRGRKKRVPVEEDPVPPAPADKSADDSDTSKDFHRPKESRLWLSSTSSNSSEKDPKMPKDAYDIFEFREEDEDLPFDNVKERLHETQRSSNGSGTEQKHEKELETAPVSEKEKKAESSKTEPIKNESPKLAASAAGKQTAVPLASKNEKSEKEPSKEVHSEGKEHTKLSMVIRIHKDGHDGATPGTAEVVKTSEALNIEDAKSDPSKNDKLSSKQDATSPDSSYNGPCKSTRKSTRLAAAQRNVDDSMDDIVKVPRHGKGTRITRRSRSNRRSEENPTIITLEPDDASEDKGKNEPVFYIPDNTVKDLPEGTKSPVHESSALTDSTASDSDKIPDRITSLRSFRITRSTASKLESQTKEATNETDSKKDNQTEEKYHNPHSKEHKDSKLTISETPKSLDDADSAVSRPPLPVLKVEVNRVKLDNTKELSRRHNAVLEKSNLLAEKTNKAFEKQTEKEEDRDSDSRSSPVVLIDPVTGFLSNVNRSEQRAPTSHSVIDSKNTSSSSSISDLSTVSTSVLNILSITKAMSSSSESKSVLHDSSKVNLPISESHIDMLPPKKAALSTVNVTSSFALPVSSISTDPKSMEKIVDPIKLPAKKAVAAALANANSSADAISPALVTANKTVPTSSSAAPMLSNDKSENVNQNPTLVVAPQESSVSKVPAVSSALVHPVVQDKCSASASVASTLVNKEVSTTYSTATTVPARPDESLVPVRSGLPVAKLTSTEHSNVVASKHDLPSNPKPDHNISMKHDSHSSSNKQDASKHDSNHHHQKTSAHPTTPSWSGSKVPSGHPAHMSTIQTSSGMYNTAKADLKHGKMPHASKGNSAFTQQGGYPIGSYEELSSAHALAAGGGGAIAELLQNPQLMQHNEYLAATGQLQERNLVQMVRPATPIASGIHPDIAARLGNPTPPHTPTPPVTSAGHTMPSADMHTSMHMRHPGQPNIIVPPHPSLLHPSELNALIRQQMMYAANPYAAALHNDIRVQQEAQARAAAMGLNSRFNYHALPPTGMVPNSFKQPSDPRHHMPIMEPVKPGHKDMNDISRIMHDSREDKTSHSLQAINSVKASMKTKKRDEKDPKRPESREELDKITSTPPMPPHGLAMRQPPHGSYQSGMMQMSPRLTVSPHDAKSDSPGMSNLYGMAQGRVLPPMSLQEEHKASGTHHFKEHGDPLKQPPIAHQNQTSANPYHQQMLMAPSAAHIDGRSPNPPNPYKKDAAAQQITAAMHNDKKYAAEQHKKLMHARPLNHQGSSVSPGPSGLAPAHSPVNWPPVIQSHLVMQTGGEQASRRMGPHGMLEPSTHCISTPATCSAAPRPSSASRSHTPTQSQQQTLVEHMMMKRYPVMWQGHLGLKNDLATVQMHYVSGSPALGNQALTAGSDPSTIRVAQRMRLEPEQLSGVTRKLQTQEEHCMLMALPCGKDHGDYMQQSENLRKGFIEYLQAKQAAGIVNVPLPGGTQQTGYVIHIFPSCEFTDAITLRFAPEFVQHVSEVCRHYLVIIITTV